jgi:N6-adenosine-specific RNA methylase IME4
MRALYRTIVADPPWEYDRAAGLGSTRAAADNYPTMTPAEIRHLPVAEYAATNAHLYLWVTNLKLDEADAFGIVRAWGFRFVTMLTWHKLGSPGMGWYFRGDTEHVLFGVRGKAPIDPAIRVSNHFAASRTGHSVKPDRFYEMVERVSPGPYLELFARRRRYGWDVWGNEAPEFAASQAEMGLGA